MEQCKMFTFTPSNITFSEFSPGKMLSQSLTIKNNTQSKMEFFI